MNKNEALQVAKSLFENHKVDEFHITKDGQGFFTKQAAENHQQGFKTDEQVISVTRAEAEAFELPVETEQTGEATTVDEATGKIEKKAAASKKK